MTERGNGVLLDTSVVIAHLRGLIDFQDLTAPEEPLFLPLVALGELYKGALKSNHPEINRLKIDEFLRIAAGGSRRVRGSRRVTSKHSTLRICRARLIATCYF
jgi:hypothetical protein